MVEYLREAAFELLGDEVPYSFTAEVEEFREAERPIYIRVTLVRGARVAEGHRDRPIRRHHQGSWSPRPRSAGRAAGSAGLSGLLGEGVAELAEEFLGAEPVRLSGVHLGRPRRHFIIKEFS